MPTFTPQLILLTGLATSLILGLAGREFLTWRVGLLWGTLLIGSGLLITGPLTPLTHSMPIMSALVPTLMINGWITGRLASLSWGVSLVTSMLVTALGSFLATLATNVSQLLTGTTPLALISLLTLLLSLLAGNALHRLVLKSWAVDYLQQTWLTRRDQTSLVALTLLTLGFAHAGLTWPAIDQVLLIVIAGCGWAGLLGWGLRHRSGRVSDARLLADVAQYNRLLSSRNQELHLFKHDYQNVLLSLAQYIENEDMTGLKAYFEREVVPNSQSLTHTTVPEQLRYLHAPAVNGLIYAKYVAAAEHQVQLQIELLETITLPNVNQLHVVRILGNLLDNAIDAAIPTNGLVRLAIERHQQTVVITVQNQLPPGGAIDLDRLSRQHVTTKPGHHGYGLSSIRQLTNHQLSVAYTVHQDTFTARLTIER
ncbi:sensor histidine kinase [Lactiplantibacillus plajomi]|uniref:Sensor histidine kinase n=1 Tax=Lactiplantibacillus plajomi TaxID=1457217 RepID=A0ABV6K3K7_9LACO|nr:GHKL domain-containing protein [Lactiplantibacillus plajomi]